MTDRRIYFFLGAALAVAAVQPIVPQYRWATISVAVLYLVFAATYAAASFSARHATRRDHTR